MTVEVLMARDKSSYLAIKEGQVRDIEAVIEEFYGLR